MKSFKALLKGMFAVLLLASVASAQTEIRLTGSTAYRKAVHIAIGNILQTGYTYAYTGTSGLSGASQAIFVGTLAAGSHPAVIVKTSWAGSVGGVKTLTQGLSIAFLDNTTVTTTAGNNVSGAGAPQVTTTANVTMSDSFQATTPFKTPALTDTIVGVVPFKWVANAGSPTSIDNITSLQAINLLNGGLPLSQFTGLSTDEGTAVYGVGRDEDSGTRVAAFAEANFGVNGSPTQYTVGGGTGSSSTVTAISFFPANTVLGTTYPAGHSGYSGGGALANALNTPGSNAGTVGGDVGPGWLIGYLGVNDAANVTLGHELKWNGVAYSVAAVREGQYTFWSYEHLMYGSSLSGTAKTGADAIAKQLHDTDAAQSGIVVSTMQVGRSTEGGAVTFGNPYP